MILHEVQQRNEEIIIAKIFMVNQVATLYKLSRIGPGKDNIFIKSYEL